MVRTMGEAEAKVEMKWRDSLRPLIGKRVEVEYSFSQDWVSGSGSKRGWLEEYENGLILVARRGSNRFTRLTGGMYDGFYATITVKSVKVV